MATRLPFQCKRLVPPLVLLCAPVLHAQSVWFEPNRGQVAGRTEWIGRSKGAYLYITGDEVVYANKKNVHMRLVGASKRATVEGAEPTGGYSSYFTGRDEKTWFTGIPHYARLRYRDVYPGVDMVYYGSGRNVEYDFVVKAGADLEQIELAFSEPAKIDGGDLIVAGLRQHRPKVVQGGREVAAEYRITEAGHVRLAVSKYDASRELTVDPVLEFSTYLGGPGAETLNGVLTDANGFIYLSGGTQSPASPALDPFQQTNLVGLAPIIMKLSPDARKIMFYAVLGANGWDFANSIALDSAGNIVVVGDTRSANLPLKNAIQTELKAAYDTVFVSKLSADGRSLIFSTYFGGGARDYSGRVVLEYPGSQSGFFGRLNAELSAIEYSSFVGSSTGLSLIRGNKVDQDGFVYVAGSAGGPDFPQKNSLQNWKGGGELNVDCFVAKFSSDGRSLIYSTLLGGGGGDFVTRTWIDNKGALLVAGVTNSQDFPAKNAYQMSPGGGQDGFLARISDASAPLSFPLTVTPARVVFRYIQGDRTPPPQMVAISGPAYTSKPSAPWLSSAPAAAGLTISVNPEALSPGTYIGTVTLTPSAGTPATIDVALTVLAAAPVLTAIEPALVAIGSDDAVITIRGSGFTSSSAVQLNGLPWTITPVRFVDLSTLQFSMPRAYFSVQYNHTIAVQNPNSALSNVLSLAVGALAPSFAAASVTNAASYSTGSVAPGEIVTIFGTNLDPKVTFDNIPATLVYSSATQVSVTVPYSITAPTTILRSGSSAPVTLPVAPSAPGIFAAVADPANAGTLTLYATGCGALTNDALPRCALPVYVSVNGQPADVLYAGVAPGLVEGANQINLRLPDGIGPGALHIVLQAGDAASKEFLFTLP